MDTHDVDKETIIATSSDSNSEEYNKKHKKNKERKRSRTRNDEKRKRNSSDSRSLSGRNINRKEERSEKYEKYKVKKDKYVDEDRYDKKRKRDSYRDEKTKENEYDKEKRDRNKRSSSRDKHYQKKDNHRKRYKSRSRSKSYRRNRDRNYRKRDKSKSNVKSLSIEKSASSIELKKKYDEITKNSNIQTPFSTSDPSKRDRELYVANLPEGLNPSNVVELMNTAMVAIGANVKSGNPILSAWISSDSNYAFLEFRTPEETNNAFQLNGISLLGKEIKIGRPRYQDETIQTASISKDMFPTLTSLERDINPYLSKGLMTSNSISKTSVSTSYNTPAASKLLVSNLPITFNEDAVYKFLRTFGKIKSLEMIKDPITNLYSGQCHVEYETESATANALHYAMGITLHGNVLYIKRSSGLVPVYSISSGGPPSSLGILTSATNLAYSGLSHLNGQSYMTADEYMKTRETNPSKIICIKNMCTIKELEDDDEYDDLYDDVMEECKNYGKVIHVKIPRPEGSSSIQGLGKVFVEYATRDGAAFAKEHLNGKNFHGRTVEVVFHPEDLYKKNQLD